MSKSTMFRQALRARSWGEAQRLASANPDLVLRQDARGQSFVSYAARDGRWDEAEWLLERGACWASAMRGWLEHGTSASLGFEALMLGRLKISLEGEPRAEPEALDGLMLGAIQARRADVVGLLAGSQPACGEAKGWAAQWRAAIKSFDPPVCQALSSANGGVFKDKALLAELGSLAVAVNNLDALGWLLENGLDVDHLDPAGRSMLGVAAGMGREAICAWLCQKGARVDLRDAAGRTPLYAAVAHGHGNCARELVGRGADPELRQGVKGHGDSPLRLAAKGGAREMRSILGSHLERAAMSSVVPVAGARVGPPRRL